MTRFRVDYVVMRSVLVGVSAALVVLLGACSAGDASPPGGGPSSAPVESSAPAPGPSVDCSDPSLDQKEWTENCATDVPQDEAPDIGDGMNRKWEFVSSTAGMGSFTIPSEGNETTAKADALRDKVDGDPVEWVVVQVDNSNGTDSMNMYKIALVDQDGKQYESMGFSEPLDEWRDIKGTDDVDLYNEFIDLSNETESFWRPGAKGEAVLAFKELPKTIKRVYVYPNGAFEETEAYTL